MSRWIIFAVSFLGSIVPSFAQTADDLFDDSVLHEIRIDVRPSDWSELRENYLENTYYVSDMHWLYRGTWVDVPQVAIRSRGLGSRSAVKPGLRVDFDRYNSDRQFLGLQSLILRNNTQDPSMLHERMSFKLMREMGITAPRAAHARLYVNGEYVGLYMLVESIDEAFVQDRFHEKGHLYEYQYALDSQQNPYRFEYRGSATTAYCPAPFEPETHESDPQCEAIEAMIRTLNEAPDGQFDDLVREYLDLRTFLKEIAVEAYLAESDGIVGDFGLNNFYLYRYSNSNRFDFIPWDKSQTFSLIDRWIWLNTDVNVLSRRALVDPALRDVFVNAITTAGAVAGGPGGWFEQEIVRAYTQIRQAALDDTNKQCADEASGSLRPCTNAEFENGAAFMISFARGRNAHVAAQIRSYSIPDRGGSSILTGGSSDPARVGYARIHMEDGNASLAGLAIFGLRQNNVLVSEAAVPATGLLTYGRIYAEAAGSRMTGLAIANPNPEPAVLHFYFTDAAGSTFGEGGATIPIGGQITRFLNEQPFNGGASFRGSFTFTSSVPVSAIALLGFVNEQGTFLTTTLPVIDLLRSDTPASTLPHFVDGAGWSTEIMLVNPYDEPLSGMAQIVGGPSFNYSIAARSSTRIEGGGKAGSGWIRLLSTGRLPVASGVFSYKNAGVTTTQAGVPAIAGSSAFRMYVEVFGDSIRSGAAIANLSGAAAEVRFELTSLSGEPTGLTGTVTIPANGHIAKFLDEIPWGQPLPAEFRGILRVSAGTEISAIGLRGRYNETGNFLITTTSPVSENVPPPPGELFFPHWVNSPDYTTQFVLYSSVPGQNVSGRLEYLSQSGEVLNLRQRE
jgi:hypothetical protein